MISKTSEGFLESDTIETAHLNRREAEKSCCWFNMRHPQMFNWPPKNKEEIRGE